MADYIFIQNRSARVKLSASRTCKYVIPVRNGLMEEWGMVDEAILVTCVYTYRQNIIAGGLRERIPDIAPDEIDRYCERIKEDHPLENIVYNWQNIPLFADSGTYCEFNLPWLYEYPIKLTAEQERELLGIVQDRTDNKEERMIKWFQRYRNQYGIDSRLKRDRQVQDKGFIDVFCLAHGFHASALQTVWTGVKNKKTPRRQKKTNDISSATWVTLISGIFLIALLFSKIDIMDNMVPYYITFCLFGCGAAFIIFSAVREKKEITQQGVKNGVQSLGAVIAVSALAIGAIWGCIELIDAAWDSGSWLLLFSAFLLFGAVLVFGQYIIKRLINRTQRRED